MKMNCNGNGGNATTQEAASWDRHHYHNKQPRPKPTKNKKKKKPHHQRQHARFLLYCLAAFTAWFIISISLLAGGSHNRRDDVEHENLSFLQPLLPTRDNNYDYDEVMEHDLNLLPPSVGLKFDWNANTKNRNNHHHRLDDRHESNDSNDDENDDDDDVYNLRMKHRRQTTMMGPNNTATTTKTLSSSSLNTTTNNNTLSNSTTLVVLSVCIPGERFSSEYIHASLYNKQTFCNKWGVECILSKQRLAPDAASSTIITTHSLRDKNTKMKNNLANTKQKKLLVYSPKWEKLYLLNRTLHTHPHADWLLWLDCDAAFSNLDINWRTHLHPYLPNDKKSKVLIASKDKSGINLGVFFIPNTPPAKQLIKLLWEERHMVERNKFYLKDQVALQRVLKARPQIQRYIDTDVPQKKINSYLDNKDGHKWQPKDWIVHQVFCHEKRCGPRFISLLKEVTPWPEDEENSNIHRMKNGVKSIISNWFGSREVP